MLNASELTTRPLVPTLLHKLMFVALALLIATLPEPGLAQISGGLQRSVTTMEQLREYAWLIIPIICLISGGIAGVLYSLDVIRKDTLYTWIGGTVFAGLIAAGVVELVF